MTRSEIFSKSGRSAAYLDLLARENALPRMILYNVNPADTFSFATLTGCYQEGDQPGKIQYGARGGSSIRRKEFRRRSTRFLMSGCSRALLAW